MLEIALAIIAGILTIGAPCILPLLPILLGASVGRKSHTRPLFITLGFILTFAIVALFLSYLTTQLHIAPDALRRIAVYGLGIFGIFMVWPAPFQKLTVHLSKYINKASVLGTTAGNGNWGGFILGMMLGVIWTPCAGPVLGSILTLVISQSDLARAGILLIAYAVGAGIPMLIVAYGGQFITTRIRAIAKYTTLIQQIFGVLIILSAIAMYFQYDVLIQAKILEFYDFTSIERGVLE